MVLQRKQERRLKAFLRRNPAAMKKGYIGTCPKHGLVRHESKQMYLDLKGGAFCPYCLSMLSDVKWESKSKKNVKAD